MTLYESLQKELGDKLRGLEQLDGSYRLLKTPQLIGDFFDPGGDGDKAADSKASRLTSVVLTLVILNQRGLLPEIDRAPEQFLRDLFSLLMKQSEEQVAKLFWSLANEGNDSQRIGPKLWSAIAAVSVREVVLVHWPKVDSLTISHPKTAADVAIRSNLAPHVTSYHEYQSYIELQLQRSVEYSDLVVLDSIPMQDYHAKGALEPIDFFLDLNTSRRLSKLREASLGRSPDGRVVALPLTRNFHVPAKGSDFNPSIGDDKPYAQSAWAPRYKKRLQEITNLFVNTFDIDNLLG
ncbi:MAG: hypothetical protein H0U97_03895 [Gammaproteobacteria bacterium]|nr:hypothetical protein [Gammaproteobacteria bacterium]